ncbi:hypothetical protein [Actinacidiphila acididurans]|uniref:Uncharacterized protein n=1 Tax=Actinacidiphila acididurans TaxID=2784346 RepID=A0ABS2TXA8_9ACTN|nr:hypothetical protein [Actinacidiphila acididurans]MBM9507978.1 hypothetical protein [Actinacidiphila acididurans]
MKVKQITLDDEEMPERVLLDCSHDEAVLIAALLGRQDAGDLAAVVPHGGRLGAEVYDALAGSVFNRFYDDGVAGAVDAIRRRP